MTIAQYLNEILLQRESVILPGFGEFKTVKKPAAKAASQKSYTPPAQDLSFNPGVKVNDYVLAKFVSEKEATTIAKGNEMIKAFVGEIQVKLDEGKQIKLPGIGLFSLDDKKKIKFEADNDSTVDKGAYGLSSAGATTAAEETPPKQKPEKADPPVVKKKKKSKLLWLLIILLILIGGVVWGYFNQDIVKKHYTNIINYFQGEDSETTIPNDTITNDMPIDTISQIDTTNLVDGTEAEDLESTETTIEPEITTPTTTETVTGTPGKYYVITGCFSNKGNADNMVIKLKEKGYDGAYIVGKTSGGLYRVTTREYSSGSEASKALLKTQTDMNLRNSWILKL